MEGSVVLLSQHSRSRTSGWNSEHKLPILDFISELKDEAGSKPVGDRGLSKPIIVTTRISPASRKDGLGDLESFWQESTAR